MVSFLTLDQIRSKAPSVFATDHDGERSDRYTFVSSEKIIDSFEELGWGVTEAVQPTSRKSDPLHNKHMLRFRPKTDEISFRDPRGDQLVHPEIINYNSSNGTCRWKMVSGAFSMICANGLTIRVQGFEEAGESLSRKHIGWDPQAAYDKVQEMSESFPTFFRVVSEMTQHDLSDEQRLEMAQAARELRFSNVDLDPNLLLSPKRGDDVGRDIWTTYNVIQENCIRPDFKLARRTARELTNIDALDRVNTSLWTIAEDALAAVN